MAGRLWRTEPVLLRYEYDFADDGGAVGTISLGNLPDDMVVTEMYVVIETTLTSAGTPVLELGNDADQDGYVANFWATRTAGEDIKGAGALITGGTHLVLAADDSLDFEIGTAALTAGKFSVYVRGFGAE